LTTFIGIDLGGARGKTTAVARLRADGDRVSVEAVRTRHPSGQPWQDELVAELADALPADRVLAINAPLTVPACVRCPRAHCPGADRCDDVTAVWLRTEGAAIASQALEEDLDRIVAVSSSSTSSSTTTVGDRPGPRLLPYVHRASEVVLSFRDNILPRACTGSSCGPIAARAAHLTRVLRRLGFTLNRDLIEVSPRATVHALFGADAARGYKRDADPWQTRADIVEGLDGLAFARTSGLSKEEVLRNDHCFEALLSAYTAFLRQRDGWQLPDDEVFAEDGYIWAPAPRP
jgi:hypothetical protein